MSNTFIDVLSGSGLPIQRTGDHDSLYLGCAFVNFGDFGVAEQALDRILLHISVSAEDLHRLCRHPHGGLARHQLGHGAELAYALSAIFRRRGGVQQRTRARYTRRHVRKLELDPLELLDGMPELLSLSRVGDRVLERGARNSYRLRRNSQTPVVQRLHCIDEALRWV